MNTFTVKVPGVDFELSSNHIYHIREVSDASAPDGYQKAGISKHPLPGIAQGIVVPHHDLTKTWDTGFHSASYSYTKEPKAKEILSTVKKELLPHLENLMEGDLTNGKSSNNEFFDDFPPFNSEGYGEDISKYKIKGGNMFNTKNPLEFLALWWALMGKQIMPPDAQDSPKYKNCSFVLEDKKQSSSIEQDNEYEKSLATSRVMSIVNSKDKKEIKHLNNLFGYVGFNVDAEEMAVKPLMATFSKWCEKGGFNNENAKDFNETYDKFEDNREEPIVYVKLLEHIKKGKIKVERSEILFKDKSLGSDKKSAARHIVGDQELHKAFLSL